jgi:hypothetical protein
MFRRTGGSPAGTIDNRSSGLVVKDVADEEKLLIDEVGDSHRDVSGPMAAPTSEDGDPNFVDALPHR